MLACFAAIIAWHLDVVPIWDARIYYSCIEEAVHKPFDLLNFRCFAHPSIAYAFVMGLTQYVAPWTPALLYVVNGVIGVAAIVAFHAIVRRLIPNRPAREYALVAALFGLGPLFVANAIFLTLDYAAAALFVLFTYFLLARRPWAAGLLGAAVAFTKETGGAAVALTTVAFAITFIAKPSMPRRERLARLRAQWPIVAVPVAALVAFLVLVGSSRQFAGWANAYATVGSVTFASRSDAWLNTNLADPSLQAFLADMFVLNCQWLLSLVVVAAIVVRLVRPTAAEAADASAPRLALFAALVVGGLMYITTRYRGFNNARYVLLMSPALIATFYGALVWLVRGAAARFAYLAVCAVLIVASNFRTIDPLSRSIFGTFEFGSHRLLDMPAMTGGLKLDALVYNLEFLQLEYVYADMIRGVRPRPGSVVLMGNAIYFFPPDVDGRRYTLTANPTRAMPLFVARGDIDRDTLAAHVTHDGDLFYYAAFANTDNRELASLRQAYELVDTTHVDRGGYTLDAYAFRFRFR
ncbi:MAG TPA: hypothetical protein VFA27_11575 [Vicinamibacterales bacterium]|nr:hypothetical protein [Vicinamibacterales bacterium]